jgi:feruloyl esterase
MQKIVPTLSTIFAMAVVIATAVPQSEAQQGGTKAPAAKGASPAGARAAAPPLGTKPKPAIANAKAVRSCESLAMVALPNTTIESALLDPNNSTVCRVTAVTTHPPAGDKVRIWVAIPTSDWNGRFIGTGGGGFSGGSAAGVNQPLQLGYAAGATDTGHEGGSGSFAMDSTGHLNWQAIRDNAHVGIHEMTVTGKALTQAMYGVAPKYSYFNGCSTGGRQGLMEAQRYPEDYNGIVAGAPAINWPKLMMQSIWSTAVMNGAGNAVAGCKIQAATAAAIEACDAIDGVKDGVIENPELCHYDPKKLIGTVAGSCGTITAADAEVIQKLWEGPRRADGTLIWHGQPWGADMTALAAARGNPLAPAAFTFTTDWIRYWLLQNPQFDANALTPQMFEKFWDQSIEEFGLVIGTDNPDLSAFRDHGGKLVMWHGWADQLITAEGTIDYYQRLTKQMGGADKVAQYLRFFLAPGIGHCGGGAGPNPSGQLDAVVSWVEDGKAPATLPASRQTPSGPRTRILCQYPMVAKYKGSGSTDDAANFSCSAGF